MMVGDIGAKNMDGYFACVLDDETRDFLTGMAVFDNVHAHHVTMAYKPSAQDHARFAAMVGREIEFDMTTSYRDMKGQAVLVHGVPSLNDNAHVTISCAAGVKPVYSNALLQSADKRATPVQRRGRGVVRFIRF
jgi:hypothetical protein